MQEHVLCEIYGQVNDLKDFYNGMCYETCALSQKVKRSEDINDVLDVLNSKGTSIEEVKNLDGSTSYHIIERYIESFKSKDGSDEVDYSTSYSDYASEAYFQVVDKSKDKEPVSGKFESYEEAKAFFDGQPEDKKKDLEVMLWTVEKQYFVK